MELTNYENSIEVIAGKFPGVISKYQVPRGSCVKDLIEVSHLNSIDLKRGDQFELRLNAETITHEQPEKLNILLSAGDRLFQLKFIKGNK